MSIDDTIRIHLQKLVERKSWRANELPQGCTVNVLRVLDDRGLIEFRSWERAEPNPQPFVNPDPSKMVVRPYMDCGWFSPSRQPMTAGNLCAVLAHGAGDPDLATEFAVSEHGRAKLAELEMGAPIEEDAPQNPSAQPVESDKKMAQAAHATFCRNGDGWDLKFGTEEGHFGKSKGLHRICKLLAAPNTLISGLTLCGGDSRCETLTPSRAEASDQQALAGYNRELEEYDEGIEKAKENKDEAQLAVWTEKKEALLAQLKRDTRVGGGSRILGQNPPAKKALITAKESIREALRKLQTAEPPLTRMAEHFQQHISTEENSLVYRPPSPALSWIL